MLRDLAETTFIETWAYLYTPEDLNAFVAEKFTLERITSDLGDPAVAFWVAELEGMFIGFSSVGPNTLPVTDGQPDDAELRKLYMLKSHQNGGVGALLFAEAIAWLQSSGPRNCYISVFSENVGAQRFYGRHGFYKVGEYGYVVGQQVDREFIYGKLKADFAREAVTNGSG